MRDAVRTLTAVVCALLVAGVLVAGVLAWRLSRGPIELGFLTHRLEKTLSAPDGSTVVQIGSTALEWDPIDRDLDLRIHELRVLRGEGAPLVTLPTLAVRVAPAALLVGTVAPSSLEAIAPRIQLIREADGHLVVGVGQAPSPQATQALAGGLLGGSAGAMRRGWTLPAVGMRDGDIVLDDRATGTTWHATHVVLAARHVSDGLTIDRLAFDLAPATVLVAGRIARGAADLQVSLKHLPTSMLERWWPADVVPVARRWVATNVSGGGITSARVTITGSLADAGGPVFSLGTVAGQFQFGRLDVRWADGMPPLTQVAGSGTLSRDGWRVRLGRGELEGLDIIRSIITPSGHAPGIRVDTTARGPLSKVLALLERPPLKSVSGVPFRPGEISGGATARVLVDVPFDQRPVDVRASGDLRSVSMRRAFRGRNLNARRLDFDLDERRFQLEGEVTIGRATFQLRWRDTLAVPDRGRRVIDLKGRLDDTGRKAVGVDLAPWLDGPVGVHARLMPQQGATDLDVSVDLAPASLDIPLLNLVKDPGAPGAAQASLILVNSQVRTVDAFHVDANGSSVNARATFGPDESVRTIDGTAAIAPRVEGHPTGSASFLLRPAGPGSQLTVTSDDAGALLRAVDSFADAAGGRLELISEVRLTVPGTPMSGTVRIDKFTLTRSPLIAKVAAFASIPVIADALAGDGLAVSQLAATFTQRGGVVGLSDCLAVGPAMALLLRGTVDRTHDELALDGTLVPNWTGLDRLSANVGPLPRSAPTSANGDGTAQAVDFTVSGSIADPYVLTKPGTTVSPVVLRDLLRATSARLESGKATATEDVEETPKRKRRPKPKRRAPAAPSARGTDTE